MDFAFNYVQQNNGIDTERCYAYEARVSHGWISLMRIQVQKFIRPIATVKKYFKDGSEV